MTYSEREWLKKRAWAIIKNPEAPRWAVYEACKDVLLAWIARGDKIDDDAWACFPAWSVLPLKQWLSGNEWDAPPIPDDQSREWYPRFSLPKYRREFTSRKGRQPWNLLKGGKHGTHHQ